MSLATVWAAIAVLLPVTAVAVTRSGAIDLAYHVRAGELMLSSGSVLRTDPFSYIGPGLPWIDQQWGAQVLFALAYRGLGWLGADLLRAAVVGLAAWLVYAACRERGVGPKGAALLSVAGWVVGLPTLSTLRPQLLGALAFSVVVWALTRRERTPNLVWLIPAVTVCWVNVHGSFPVVFLLIGLAAWDDLRRHRVRSAVMLGWAGVASLVATAVGPFGPSVWRYVVEISTNPIVREHVGEWQRVRLMSIPGLLLWASIVAVAAACVFRRRRLGPVDFVTLAIFAAGALAAARGVAWWALLFPVVMGRALVPADDAAPDGDRPVLDLVVIGTLLAMVVASLSLHRGLDPGSGASARLSLAPERLVIAARERLDDGDRVFVSQQFASWVEFSAPEFLLGVDSRIEVFPAEAWDDYFTVSSGAPGWEEILDRIGVRALIVTPEQSAGLVEALRGHAGWRLVEENRDGYVFVRA